MKIGVLGGTFDPPHGGHLALAKAAIAHLELDEVLFMPANRNPNKRPPVAAAKQRLAMVRLMLQDEPLMAVSDLEIARGGPSYAVDTMEQLQFARPAEYWFLVGSDAVRDLSKWKQPSKLLHLCRLAVTVRLPSNEPEVLARATPEVASRMDLFPMPAMDVSSSEIRNKIEIDSPTSPYLDARVKQYIETHKLYKELI